MELMSGYHYRMPGEFQAQINRVKAEKRGFPGYWTTREGLVILPQNMNDGHLLNSIRMTERRYADQLDIPDIRDIAIKVIDGRYRKANYSVRTQEIVRTMQKSKTYIDMVKEARDRGILE